MNAFRRSGIYPFDSGAVDYSWLVTNLNPMEREQERQINNLVMDAIVHEPNPNAYTMSRSGKVDPNEMVVDPVEGAVVPIQQATEPTDEAQQDRTNTTMIENLTKACNNRILNDPDKVTEVDKTTGEELVCIQPKVSLKTEDGTVIGTVPVVMIPVKHGSKYVSKAAKKLKEKEDEITKMLEEKGRKQKQGTENIRRYVSKAQSGNEALDYFAKKDEERKRQIQEKE